MKKSLLVLIVGTLLIGSCSDTTNSKNEAKNDTIVKNESAQNEDVVNDKVEEKMVYFEDYADVKNKEALIEKYGSENIKNSTESFAEGTIEREVSILTDPQNGYVIKYVWDEDNKTLSWLEASEMLFNDNNEVTGKQTIKAINGLWLGMTLKDLRDWNEADFKFSGFGWDFGGGVFAEQGSKIANSPIGITLNYSGNDIPDFAMGDIQLRADDERLKDLNITVSHFNFYPKK